VANAQDEDGNNGEPQEFDTHARRLPR
jgi:hypothetical protein